MIEPEKENRLHNCEHLTIFSRGVNKYDGTVQKLPNVIFYLFINQYKYSVLLITMAEIIENQTLKSLY